MNGVFVPNEWLTSVVNWAGVTSCGETAVLQVIIWHSAQYNEKESETDNAKSFILIRQLAYETTSHDIKWHFKYIKRFYYYSQSIMTQ